MKKGNYILWLPSWYPNEREPFSGDFIQRHALAASINNEITVIFFPQFGEAVTQEGKVATVQKSKLKEITVYIPYKPLGISPVDRIRYNTRFYNDAAKYLESYFEEHGLPLLVHVHIPVKAGNLAMWVKKKFCVPYIVSEHSSTYLEQAGEHYFKSRHWLYRASVKRIFSDASIVTNVSQAVGDILKKMFRIKELQVIHNVVDTTIFNPVHVTGPCFTYIHVSSLTEQKNIVGILRVFKRMASIRTDWRLLVVGPYTPDIELFIKEQHLDQFISLVGEVPYEIVANYINQSNVMVLFSRHENFPCVVIESLCCGVPVISSDVAGIKECVNGSNGILVESENEEQLLQALLSIRDKYHKYDLISISESASSQFSYQSIAAKFDQLYKHAFRVL